MAQLDQGISDLDGEYSLSFDGAALALKANLFALITFAAISGLRRDQVRWNAQHQAYTNSYSFARLYELLPVQSPQFYVADLGTQEPARYWFPRKTRPVFCLRLAESCITCTPHGWERK